MKISVISPTINRADRHSKLYSVFAHQTYEDKELYVLDDSREASPFFSSLKDPRVHYTHDPSVIPLGVKRNILVNQAQGTLIAHFDDDDYYAPTYLETMVSLLKNGDFVKLSRWLIWSELSGTLWEWDTRYSGGKFFCLEPFSSINNAYFNSTAKEVEEWDENLWGFGFSYFYKKSLWKEVGFKEISMKEDALFLNEARVLGKKCIHSAEHPNLILHTIHKQSTSRLFPQKKLAKTKAIEIFGPAVEPWLINFN